MASSSLCWSVSLASDSDICQLIAVTYFAKSARYSVSCAHIYVRTAISSRPTSQTKPVPHRTATPPIFFMKRRSTSEGLPLLLLLLLLLPFVTASALPINQGPRTTSI